MKALNIWFKQPRTIHKSVEEFTLGTDVSRKVTTITEDKIMDSNMKIPICPYINGVGIQQVILSGTRQTIIIANLLVLGLRTAAQNNTVEVTLQELITRSNLSKPTIIEALDWLEDNQFIERVKKGTYKISARLAWFGNQVDWAIELKRLREIQK